MRLSLSTLSHNLSINAAGPYAVLSVCGFILGALVAAAVLGLAFALRRRRRGASGAGNGFPATGGYSPGEHTCAHDPAQRCEAAGFDFGDVLQ